MFHHIPALKFEPSPDANNPEEFLLYNMRIVQWAAIVERVAKLFLATLVALHLTPVSDSVADSFGLA